MENPKARSRADEAVKVDVSENSVDSEYQNPDADQFNIVSDAMLDLDHLHKVVMKFV